MRNLWYGWWQREGNVSAIHNESIKQVRRCSVCDLYMLISFSICHLLPDAKKFAEGRFCPCHRAQAVSRRHLTAKVAMSNIFRADNGCAHQISNGLLIGCRFLFFQLPLSPYLVPQGFRAQTHTVVVCVHCLRLSLYSGTVTHERFLPFTFRLTLDISLRHSGNCVCHLF
jgi:hypothetical protein